MSLNDLFVQIFESEQRAKERKVKISGIKDEISKTSRKIQETRDDAVRLKGQLAIQMQQLTEKELQMKLINAREKILKEQVAMLKAKKDISQTELKKIQEKWETARCKFLERLKAFNGAYDLTGVGKQKRNEEAIRMTEEVKATGKELEKEVASLREKQKELDDLIGEKMAINEEILLYKQKIVDVGNKIKGEVHKSQVLGKEKKIISTRPSTDAEFQRYHQELEACKKDSLEGLCQALRKEVDQAQRQHWQSKFHCSSSKVSSSGPINLQSRPLQASWGFQSAGEVLSVSQVSGLEQISGLPHSSGCSQFSTSGHISHLDAGGDLGGQARGDGIIEVDSVLNEYRKSNSEIARKTPQPLSQTFRKKMPVRGRKVALPQTKVTPQQKEDASCAMSPPSTLETNSANSWSRFRILPPQPPTPNILSEDPDDSSTLHPLGANLISGVIDRGRPNLARLRQAMLNTSSQISVNAAVEENEGQMKHQLQDKEDESGLPSLAKKVRFKYGEF